MFVARKKESVVYNVHCGSILSLVGLGSVGTATCTGADPNRFPPFYGNWSDFS